MTSSQFTGASLNVDLPQSCVNAERWIRSVCVVANHNLAYVCFTCSTP